MIVLIFQVSIYKKKAKKYLIKNLNMPIIILNFKFFFVQISTTFSTTHTFKIETVSYLFVNVNFLNYFFLKKKKLTWNFNRLYFSSWSENVNKNIFFNLFNKIQVFSFFLNFKKLNKHICCFVSIWAKKRKRGGEN